ncbi:MAG: methionine/alanine import family NSS transporter small subunit [Firmicutes bacterium]|nr:methionine/alanine import family NSS transporter small subunit [Bacillota bacterium]
MSASAIVMMLIACIGLWGGIAVSLVIMMKSNRKKAEAANIAGESLTKEWSEAEMLPDQDELKRERLEKELEKLNQKKN